MNKTTAIGLLVAGIAGLAAWFLARPRKMPEGSAEWGPLIHGPAGADINLGNPGPDVGAGLIRAGSPEYDAAAKQGLLAASEQEAWNALNRYRYPIPTLYPAGGDSRIIMH